MTRKLQIAKILTLVFSFIVLPLLLLLLSLANPAAAATPKHYTELITPPAPSIRVPKYSQFQMSNGITVYLLEDHELPLVSGLALVSASKRLEPSEKTGLAAITGQVMRSGGTRQHSADALNTLLEERAASVETFVSTTAGGGSFFSLGQDLDQVLGLFAEVLREPIFASEQVELAKTQQRGSVARRNDDPENIVGREFQKLIYGTTSPYARTVEYATLDNISQQDLVKFHQQYFQPQGMLLGLVGDFNSRIMQSRIEATFGDWQPSAIAQPMLPSVSQVQSGGLFLVNQPQLNQSYVQIGHLGGRLDSPDYAALSVMNQVLSGFGGRLFNEVRSRQGLAYSVYADWNPQYDYPGLFLSGGQTRSETTVPFIQALQVELQKIRSTPINDQELTQAKDSVTNGFVFNFQDSSQTLSRLLWYQYYHYPPDFIFRFQKAVKATTIADVQQVARTYLKPEKLVTLVVGNRTKIKPPLENLLAPNLQVNTIDVAIPKS
jgi:zinc protease